MRGRGWGRGFSCGGELKSGESDAPKLGFYAENRGREGVKSVILTRKTAPHPMDVGRNRVRGGRRARDDARGGGEQGGAFPDGEAVWIGGRGAVCSPE